MATSNCCVDTSMRALEHFVIMANTCNSFTIREYFLDLKRIKDSTIGKLREDIHMLMDKTDRQTQHRHSSSKCKPNNYKLPQSK